MTMTGDPLTGRDSEMDLFAAPSAELATNRGAVIVGAAGVGKTRLAREVLTRAEASGRADVLDCGHPVRATAPIRRVRRLDIRNHHRSDI